MEKAVERLGRNNAKRITDHGLRLIEEMAREGCSETTIAKRPSFGDHARR
jgi:hypothetical protein